MKYMRLLINRFDICNVIRICYSLKDEPCYQIFKNVANCMIFQIGIMGNYLSDAFIDDAFT